MHPLMWSVYYYSCIISEQVLPLHIYLRWLNLQARMWLWRTESSAKSVATQPKRWGSCMQALAIILQVIWFLSNQTDETRYHPEQWNEWIFNKTPHVIPSRGKNLPLDIFYNHFNMDLKLSSIQTKVKMPFYTHMTCVQMALLIDVTTQLI